MQNKPSVAVLMTCHNRSAKTLRALHHLFRQQDASCRMAVYLVDDGCTDDTPQRVAAKHPEVRLIAGDGTLYWGGGTARAFAAARDVGHDFYLWLNDDTFLFEDALRRLLATYHEVRASSAADCIIVGSTRSETGTKANTGGRRSSRWRPFRFDIVEPGHFPRQCATFNGNCVLIPCRVAEAVGSLDPTFRHYIGDIDYGLRARESGFQSWVAPGFVATCEVGRGKPVDLRGPRDVLRILPQLGNPKGVNLPGGTLYSFREWAHFASRHGGPLWFVYFALPYRRLLKGLISWTHHRA
jgi:GT2 family glycosyltransferase